MRAGRADRGERALDREQLHRLAHRRLVALAQRLDRRLPEGLIVREQPLHRLVAHDPVVGEQDQRAAKTGQRLAVLEEVLRDPAFPIDSNIEEVVVLDEPGEPTARDAEFGGSDVGLIDSGFSSRRKCDAAYINNFKLHRGKPAQPALATLTVILSLDPGNDRQTKLFTRRPHLPIEHILLQKREEALHRRVITGSTHTPHRSLQLVST